MSEIPTCGDAVIEGVNEFPASPRSKRSFFGMDVWLQPTHRPRYGEKYEFKGPWTVEFGGNGPVYGGTVEEVRKIIAILEKACQQAEALNSDDGGV